VLICHGSRDQTIPVTHSRILAKKFPYVAKYLEIESAGHADLLSYPEVWQTIQMYLDVLKNSQRSRNQS
jgi:pimeloyl-ACP methyl ester carboxylesterase